MVCASFLCDDVNAAQDGKRHVGNARPGDQSECPGHVGNESQGDENKGRIGNEGGKGDVFVSWEWSDDDDGNDFERVEEDPRI